MLTEISAANCSRLRLARTTVSKGPLEPSAPNWATFFVTVAMPSGPRSSSAWTWPVIIRPR